MATQQPSPENPDSATMAAQQPPAATAVTTEKSPIDQGDVKDWTDRFNAVIAQPSGAIKNKSPEDAQPWHAALWECFSPVDSCLVTCCCPCVTFGKTHHRMKKGADMKGYQPVNTSCLLFCVTAYVGLWAIPMSMQRAEIRSKYNLKGSCVTDLALAFCCNCCTLMQDDKEAAHREALLGKAIREQYPAQGGMVYPAQDGTVQPAQGGVDHSAQGGIEHSAQGGMQQPAQGGMTYPAQGNMQQPVQGDIGYPTQAGMQQPAQGGMVYPAQGGMQQPVQGDMGYPTQVDMQQQAQGGMVHQAQSGVEYPGQNGMGYPTQGGMEHPPQGGAGYPEQK